MAPHIPEIEHSDAGVQSLDSFSSSTHGNSVPSYADQQLEVERAEEAAREGGAKADKAARDARDFTARAEKEAHSKFDRARGEASKDWKNAKKEARKAEDWAEKNRKNPVVVGNVVVVASLGALLGVGAYRMNKAGTLTWNVVGAWAGAVGLFAVGDYFVSQYFFKKYPPKN